MMQPYWTAHGATLYLADCRQVMAALPEASVDAVVTDPPYELGFMGRGWDRSGIAYNVTVWCEALRVLKPGGHLVAFGGTRTFHRLTCAIEDAGFEIRDCLTWLYGSGFPKSLDVSKAIDKAAGAEREVTGPHPTNTCPGGEWCRCETDGRSFSATKHAAASAPATDAARQWVGWGTALKPGWEPAILARKPLSGTVAQNVLAHGTGAINVDACRVTITDGAVMARNNRPGDNGWKNSSGGPNAAALNGEPTGRWPANVLLDEEAAALLDASVGERGGSGRASGPTLTGGSDSVSRGHFNGVEATPFYGDSGGPSRFYYTAKASRTERETGLDGLDPLRRSDGRAKDIENPRLRTSERRNDHPTVKPVSLMRWLCTLVTPPGGLILDPFMGSGSTGVAALELGFRFTGIDLDEHFVEIAHRRMTHERPMRMGAFI